MRPILNVFSLLLLTLAAASAVAGEGDGAFPDYLTEYEFLPTTPGVAGGAAGAFVLPAAWAASDRPGTAIWWDDRDLTGTGLENWGFSTGRTLGLSVQHRTYAHAAGPLGVTDWQLGLTRGDRRHMSALAWHWHTGDGRTLGREKSLAFSTLHRPGRHLSFGLNGELSLDSSARRGIVDVGWRPLGHAALTVFGDYVLRDGTSLDEGGWGAGVSLRPVPGLSLGVKFRDVPGSDDLRATFAVGVTIGQGGIHVMPGYDTDGRHTYTSYLWESGPPRAPLPVDIVPDLQGTARRYVTVNLENRRLTYQRYKWFDDERVAWLDLARLIETIEDRDDVAGVVFNLAGFSGRPSLIWEFRERLQDLRAHGLEIVIHIDRAGMLHYGLASVADHLSLDPQGMLGLPGVQMSRTYMKDMLDKLGLGFEALQLFDHKTAVEALSRREMSPADRQQRGRIVDVVYEEIRAAVVEGRGLDDATFDAIVDDEVFIFAAQAVELGLVDHIARWHELPAWLETERGGVMIGPDPSWFRTYHDERWGSPPQIAVIYAVGECDMDSGIRGRATSEYLHGLVENPAVAAVVLRADSPGGDPLPSDLVAGAVRRLRAAGKPVIVSQGDVAASGGYWISMDGSEVLTTPLTITGSIGVISGWLWDAELHEKAGLAADGVARGKHADTERSVRYPLLGLNIPARPLSDEESDLYHRRILELYDEFVDAVATGRGLDAAKVREVGGGRVWMGGDAIDHGLCDGFGGLTDAIARARALAGIPPDAEMVVREYPPRQMFEFPNLGTTLPELELALERVVTLAGRQPPDLPAPLAPEMALLRLLAECSGRPSLLLLPDELPEAWRQGEYVKAPAP